MNDLVETQSEDDEESKRSSEKFGLAKTRRVKITTKV